MTKVVSLDFELGSLLNLREVGADVWTKHPSTLPIVCGFALDHDAPECIDFDEIKFQFPKNSEHERELLDAVDDGAEIHAWNAPFEWAVWNNICVPRFNWPALPIERFHCTMAAAACAGLPMALNDAALAVGSPYHKDMSGHRNMLRMSRPRSIEPNGKVHWWHREEPAKLKALIDYNLDDVRAEREVHLRIPRMTKREREIWLVDQRMNARGLPVDRELLTALHAITLQELLRLNAEIARLTNGVVTGSSQNMKLLAWATSKGYPHLTLDRDTLDAFIPSPEFFNLPPYVQDVLMLRAEAAKTSTAKLHTIAEYAQIDGVVRNLVQYGGAVRTMRWAGRGPQIQNFPRPIIKNVDSAIEQIKLGMDANSLRLLFGKPLDVVSSCLRGVFAAPEGYSFVIADYHAIEAIVIAWLAEFDDMLDVFRRGEDIYEFTAKGVGSTNRQLGKVLRLACGYGMGHVKFQDTAAGSKLVLTLAQAKDAVDAFRRANAPIVSLWHACENRAKEAILSPGDEFQFRKLTFRMAKPRGRLAGALLMTLPSGRNLVYRNARLDAGRIVFWGVNQFTRKWCEQDTYGGKLCLSGDALVLTEQGWLRLDRIKKERVWDGVEFVEHDGLLAKGANQVVELDGVYMTPNHAVLTTEGWINASSCTGFDRAPVSLPDGAALRRVGWREITLARPMRLWGREDNSWYGVSKREAEVLRLSTWPGDPSDAPLAWNVQASSLCSVALDDRPLSFADTPSVEELRRKGDYCLPGMGNVQSVLERHGRDVSTRFGDRTREQRCRVFIGELYLGDAQTASQQSPQQVYDLINAGPRHRFVVAGRRGPLIVHNCENATQAVARDLLADAIVRVENSYANTLLTTVHDEIIAMTREADAGGLFSTMRSAMRIPPPWGAGLPLSCKGAIVKRYGKL